MAHVLLVDDDEEIRVAVTACLESEGIRVSVAGHGGEAWELLQKPHPHYDVVVTDMRMPVCDGRGLIGLMRQRADTREIPCILLTADETVREPNVSTLKKPFDMDRLIGAVEKAARGAPALPLSRRCS